MTAISGALTLLTNTVMSWNASRFEQAIADPAFDRPKAHIRHIAPIAHAHINIRGTITFDLEQHRRMLVSGTKHGQRTASDTG